MTQTTPYQEQSLPFAANGLDGLSEKTIQIHHDKLYVGYVNKMNEIGEKLGEMRKTGVGLDKANQSYSELRALRMGETFATNGVYLHEAYFKTLGGNGTASGPLVDEIVNKYDSLEKFMAFFSATGMAVRGWVVLAWDMQLGRLKIYGCDAHNQGGVWGCVPLLVMDVYEHAYFIDYGSDRAAYITAFWKNINWHAANTLFEKIKNISV